MVFDELLAQSKVPVLPPIITRPRQPVTMSPPNMELLQDVASVGNKVSNLATMIQYPKVGQTVGEEREMMIVGTGKEDNDGLGEEYLKTIF